MHPSHSLLPETPKAENMRDKASLRRHYRQLRRTTPAIHEAIYGAALSFVRRTTTETSVVGLYWPLANEVDLRSLRTQLPNPMALPQAPLLGAGIPQPSASRSWPLQRLYCKQPLPSAWGRAMGLGSCVRRGRRSTSLARGQYKPTTDVSVVVRRTKLNAAP